MYRLLHMIGLALWAGGAGWFIYTIYSMVTFTLNGGL